MNHDDRLAELLEQWEDALQQGHPVTPSELCAATPEFLPAFERLLGALGPLNAILAGDRAAPSPQDTLPAKDAGRYHVLSHHASGGLGQVFLAEDTELHRTVALKRIHGLAALDDDARRRFLYEAEVTSKLDHPGIVPVFGAGSDGGGKPYYAMRFINGPTLADSIERFHDSAAGYQSGEFRKLLRGFISVCQTIAYAHTRSVIHRDLKPGNIMLGAYGETLVVDWGLAKRLAHRDAPVSPVQESLNLRMEGMIDKTSLGLVKGSPAYMSPEQARGDADRIGPASDIYSLGATLYVLLTGKRPYEGKSSNEVVEKVLAGGLQPPRQVNPHVPRALEAICLKAMRSQPEDRYASALDLVHDLEQWLADEPVSAWREPWTLRLRRWLKRHRTFVTASAAAVLVAGAVLTWSAIVIGLKNWELGEKNTALTTLNRDLEASVQKERRAREQTEQVLFVLRDTQNGRLLRDEARFTSRAASQRSSPERLAELDAVVKGYQDAAKIVPENPILQGDLGIALARRAIAGPGDLTEPAVRRRFEQARDSLQAAVTADPAHSGARTWLALTYLEMGKRWNESGKLPDAQTAFLTARTQLADVVHRSGPIPAEVLIFLAEACAELNHLGELTSEPVPALLVEWTTQARESLGKARQEEQAGETYDKLVTMLVKLRIDLICLETKRDKVPDMVAALAALQVELTADSRPKLRVPTEFALLRARISALMAAGYIDRKQYDLAVIQLNRAQVELSRFDGPTEPEVRKELSRVVATLVRAVLSAADSADRSKPDHRMALRSLTRLALVSLSLEKGRLSKSLNPAIAHESEMLRKELDRLRKEEEKLNVVLKDLAS